MKISDSISAFNRFQNINSNPVQNQSNGQAVNNVQPKINNTVNKLLSTEEKKHFENLFPGLDFAYSRNNVGKGSNIVKNKSVGLGRFVDIKA